MAVAYVYKWFYTVCAQIWVYRKEICVKAAVGFRAYLYASNMTGGIGCGGRADVASLCIADYNQPLFLTVVYSSLIYL